MTKSFSSKARLALVSVLGVATLAGAAAPAFADPRQDDRGPVLGCDAPGGRQEAGAVVGAVLGAVIGNHVASHERTAGTIGGAVIGGALGSAIGCQQQRDRQTRDAYGYGYERQGYDRQGYDGRGYDGRGYDGRDGRDTRYGQGYGNGYGDVAPARYERMNQWMVADTRVAVRQAPSDRSPRIGALRSGQRFQAVGQVRRGEWIVVADHGAVIGYVPGDQVSPLGRSQYAWAY